MGSVMKFAAARLYADPGKANVPTATTADLASMSAFGGTAEVESNDSHFRLRPLADLQADAT
jgi:hypothetical protein